VHPDDLARFHDLDVLANCRRYEHAKAADDQLTLPFLGSERSGWQYPFGRLLRSGAQLCFGSDWPVSSPDPLWEMHVAVNRTVPPGYPYAGPGAGNVFLPGDRIGLHDAIAAATIGSAYVNHADEVSGSLEVGKAADLVVLDRNLFACPVEDIALANVDMTISAGQIVYERRIEPAGLGVRLCQSSTGPAARSFRQLASESGVGAGHSPTFQRIVRKVQRALRYRTLSTHGGSFDERVANAAASGTFTLGGDLRVHRLGFGAMRLTGPGVWGAPADKKEAIAVLRRAVELGVNFIDTADSYGPEVSETLIADSLHPYPDDLVIATKGGQVRPGPGRWNPDGRPEHLREACEGSLRRLKLEQIPLYQLHRADPKVPYAESIGALVELKQEGKIRHIGVSNVSEAQLREAESLTPVVGTEPLQISDVRRKRWWICAIRVDVFLPWAAEGCRQGRARARGGTRRERHTADRPAWLPARSPQTLPTGHRSPEHVEENVAAAPIS
jgi:aryl-alcohol dehydrogenase-like predicted oxidoreductase